MRTNCFLALLVLLGFGAVGFADKPAPDAKRVRALIEQLDDDLYVVRERAEKQLRGLGRAVMPLLEEVFKKAASVEVRWRLGRF
jgi:hypothetical protein